MTPRNGYGILRDREVVECDFEAYVKDAQNPEDFEKTRRVAKTQVSDGVLVSTVFLGIDHGWGDVPRWFETMVFIESQSSLSEELANAWSEFQARYSTWDEAQAGHKMIVTRLKEGLSPHE